MSKGLGWQFHDKHPEMALIQGGITAMGFSGANGPAIQESSAGGRPLDWHFLHYDATH